MDNTQLVMATIIGAGIAYCTMLVVLSKIRGIVRVQPRFRPLVYTCSVAMGVIGAFVLLLIGRHFFHAAFVQRGDQFTPLALFFAAVADVIVSIFGTMIMLLVYEDELTDAGRPPFGLPPTPRTRRSSDQPPYSDEVSDATKRNRKFQSDLANGNFKFSSDPDRRER
jgi:hypothetical protein